MMCMMELSRRLLDLEEKVQTHLSTHHDMDLEVKREARLGLLSPREMCRRHGVQACHCCERLACCDNLSPGADLFRAVKAVMGAPVGAVNVNIGALGEAVKKLEEMG